MKKYIGKYFGITVTALVCTFYIIRSTAFPLHDFANYYFGGYFLSNGNFTTNVYFPYEFNTKIAALGYTVFGNYAPNTPFLAMLFYPFAFLKPFVAKCLFNIISSLLFLWSLQRLASFYKIKRSFMAILPLLFFIPIKNNLLFGQVYFLLFSLLTESWLAYEKKRFKAMAALLGIAVLLKIFPVLLLGCFVFKKEFRPLLYTIISCGFLVLLSIVFCGWDVWCFYLKTILPKASNGEIATAFVDNYQSVFMFLKRMLVFDPVENPEALFDSPKVFTGFVWGFKLIVLAIGFFVTRNVTTKLFTLSYWIVAMLLLSPYGSTYTFLLLIFPFLALSKYHLPAGEKVFFATVLLLANNFPLSVSANWSFPFSYLKLLFFGLFLLGFVALAFKKINWTLAGLVFLIPFLLLLIPIEKNNAMPRYALNDGPILIHDYQLSKDKLTYFYWNEKGENQMTIPFDYKIAKPIEIKENQIYYNGKTLTSDKSNKIKPLLVDEHTVIYLSDLDRGIGFYTLRKLHIH